MPTPHMLAAACEQSSNYRGRLVHGHVRADTAACLPPPPRHHHRLLPVAMPRPSRSRGLPGQPLEEATCTVAGRPGGPVTVAASMGEIEAECPGPWRAPGRESRARRGRSRSGPLRPSVARDRAYGQRAVARTVVVRPLMRTVSVTRCRLVGRHGLAVRVTRRGVHEGRRGWVPPRWRWAGSGPRRCSLLCAIVLEVPVGAPKNCGALTTVSPVPGPRSANSRRAGRSTTAPASRAATAVGAGRRACVVGEAVAKTSRSGHVADSRRPCTTRGSA
jgi:hypothetical protein